MSPRLILFLALLAVASVQTPSLAQDWTGYKETSLDAIVATWDKITAKEHLGVTIIDPQNVHFVEGYAAAPKPCRNGLLQMIFTTNGMADVPKRIPMTHCVTLASATGRKVDAFIQDSIVPGLEKDATLGGKIEVYAVLVGYVVAKTRADNHPVLVINRFEPR